ncbi:DNA helicase [Burkholderia phage vB_BglM_WTB]
MLHEVPGMKTKAMGHQFGALQASNGKRNFAYLMEQGTGKTWTTLADAVRAWLADKIDGIAVIAPNGVHTNWVRREIPTHVAVPVRTHAWRGGGTKKELKEIEALYAPTVRREMIVFTINVEAVNFKKGYEALERFLATKRIMLIVDESTRIKSHSASRTKKITKLSKEYAVARRILTGTPLTKAPTDLFSQFEFLKSGLLGTTSYRAFVSQYSVLLEDDDPKMIAVMKSLAGKTGVKPQLVQVDDYGNPMYRNLDKLRRMIAPHSFRVTKEDCLDLPPKVYQSVGFELSAEQRKVYELLQEEYEYQRSITLDALYEEQPSARDWEPGAIDSYIETHSFAAIAARTKMKQVTSGFINIEGEPELMPDGANPRMDVFCEVVEDIHSQFLVWCLYEDEILAVAAKLREKGLRVETYYGKTKTADRERIIDEYQAGKIDVIVGHAAAMGIGLTLTAGKVSVYYSCGFDNELRKQSEDRNHRIGTTTSVLYIDLIAYDTIDEDVVRSLAFKSKLADFVIDGKGEFNH